MLGRERKALSHTVIFILAILPPGFTYSHLSIGTATQYEGNRLNEEVSEGEEGTVLSSLCVLNSPVCQSTKEEVGFGQQATALCSWWS